MSAVIKTCDIMVELLMRNHPAWVGRIPGLQADKLVRGAKPYNYILREGEFETQYYVTFVHADGVVRHTPFIIYYDQGQWYFEQGGVGGGYEEETIGDVIHLIMHCNKEEAAPFTVKK